MKFQLKSSYKPTGDQPKAIAELTQGLAKNYKAQTLLGVTGSGKTFTMANIIEKIQKPTLIISHNKTLAAQLASEFRQYFPKNAVHYFVSYYDYYQPEAYIPTTDTYIEKDADINDEIDRLRNAATYSLLTRKDVIICASVSCIYGLGNPVIYRDQTIKISKGEKRGMADILRALIAIQYERNDIDFIRGRFRVRGDTLEIYPSYEEKTVRVEFFGDEIEKIRTVDAITGEVLDDLDEIEIFPAKHFVTPATDLPDALADIRAELADRVKELKKQGKELEAQRLAQRTKYDLETIEETSYCKGIENYSRHLDRRAAGQPPAVLLDYFPAFGRLGRPSADKPADFLLIIDESHMTIPQLHSMYEGDLSRKGMLIEHGFRLPSALDNRPLKFPEFEKKINKVIFTSATPGPYELANSGQIIEQIVRPTGLIDPAIEVRQTESQIDDLISEIKTRADPSGILGTSKKERVLVTTMTKRLAEELSEFLVEKGIKTAYLHSDIATLERIDILRDLRLGNYDCLVGINLLREGLDLPEVSLVAILDADKEGFLRSTTPLIQTMGRAARHINGKVIMYADSITKSMREAIGETNRRRKIQEKYNLDHGITPKGIKKKIHDIAEHLRAARATEAKELAIAYKDIPKDELNRVISDLRKQMKLAADNLEFEKAAELRDEIQKLRFDLKK
jgi:excinuclease ABC subunit B